MPQKMLELEQFSLKKPMQLEILKSYFKLEQNQTKMLFIHLHPYKTAGKLVLLMEKAFRVS